MNIVVLAGGISTEREISIVSGTMVCKALRERGHRAVLIDVYCGDERLDVAQVFPEGCGVAGGDSADVKPGPALDMQGCGVDRKTGQSDLDTQDCAAAGGDDSDPFGPDYDVDAEAAYMRSFDGKIGEMKRVRRQFFGPNVLELCQAADVVFMALHGEDGEGGKVQAVFDLMGIRYTGSGPLGSAVAMDKGMSRAVFAAHGVPTAAGMTLLRGEPRGAAARNGIGLPCVVKPCCGGSSVGVTIAHTEEEYQAALEAAFGLEEEVVVEQYIAGREFSVAVVDGKAYPVIEIAPISGFYDYKNKYQAGSTVETCPAELSASKTSEMQQYAERAYEALKLDCYARMDFMMDQDDRLYCLEANTLPGMTPTSLLPQEAAVLGMDFPALCEHLIEVSGR